MSLKAIKNAKVFVTFEKYVIAKNKRIKKLEN